MFGSWWVWPVVGTIGFIAMVGALKLLADAALHIGDTGGAIDPLIDELWHRYEEGDLTREELERERSKRRKNAA